MGDINNVFRKLNLYISNYARSDTEVSVGFRMVYEDNESTLGVSIPITPDVIKRKSDFFIRRAFRALKKDIKDWVNIQSQDNTIIGQPFIFDPNEF